MTNYTRENWESCMACKDCRASKTPDLQSAPEDPWDFRLAGQKAPGLASLSSFRV